MVVSLRKTLFANFYAVFVAIVYVPSCIHHFKFSDLIHMKREEHGDFFLFVQDRKRLHEFCVCVFWNGNARTKSPKLTIKQKRKTSQNEIMYTFLMDIIKISACILLICLLVSNRFVYVN